MHPDSWRETLDERLSSQLQFLIEVDRLKLITRASRISDGSRHENSAEHSWHIALFAAVLEEWAIGNVSITRVVRMLLIHDIVEIDAGDVPLWADSSAAVTLAAERAAAERLFGLLPPDQCREFRGLWEEFEAADSADARFARAVDRLQPILLNHATGGGTWVDYAVDESQVRRKTGHMALGSPALWQAAEVIFADAVARGWLKPGATLKAQDPGR